MKQMNRLLCLALAMALISIAPAALATASSEGDIIIDIDLAAAQGAEGLRVDSLVENHPDVAQDYATTANTVYTITDSGIYRFTGVLENGQIRVDAPASDDIQIILAGVTLTNYTAPAIYVKAAADTGDTSMAPVRLTLEAGSHNIISGSHYAEHVDEQGITIDHDGAISSTTSLVFDGEGSLELLADNEGIEGLMHLIFNGGDISILAHDDAINGSTDGESHIIFNGGRIAAKSILGKEGDGIDSNGYITINGGTVIAIAHPDSMDSGLDSDLGITINGGIVAASGNMYDEINTSTQRFMHLVFTARGEADVPVVLTDEGGRALMAFAPPVSYTQLTLSTPEMGEGLYQVYTGGSLDGQARDGLYPAGSAYVPGILQQNGGSTQATGRMGGGMRPRDEQRQPPEGMGNPPQGEASQFPGTPPEGERPQPPEGDAGQQPLFDPQNAPSPSPGGILSTAFSLSAQSYYFIGVQAAQ